MSFSIVGVDLAHDLWPGLQRAAVFCSHIASPQPEPAYHLPLPTLDAVLEP